jgi:hypothetical protein
MIDPALFFPKALNIRLSGRSSDLSRFSEAFPSASRRTVAGISVNHHPINLGSGITAAGTVADSNRIPFSSQ